MQGTESFEVGFHTSNVLLYLAQQYGTIETVVREIVQNQLDAEASESIILLDLRKSRLKAWDNGIGATKEELRERIGRIGARMKSEGKIGRYGIGNLAPIGIINRKQGIYRMITHPVNEPTQPRFEVRFDPGSFSDKEDVKLEVHDVEHTLTGPQGRGSKSDIPYTTLVDVQNIEFSALRRFKDTQSARNLLVRTIADAFSQQILDKKTKITIIVREGAEEVREIVKPIEFPGVGHEITLATHRGAVRFELYMSWTAHPNPRLLIVHDRTQGFPLVNLTEIWPEIEGFFESGHVQGRIHVSGFCILTADRSRFELNQDLDILHRVLVDYARDYGMPWLCRVREAKRVERYSAIAEKLIERLEKSIEIPASFRVPAPTGDTKIPRSEIMDILRPPKPEEASPKKGKKAVRGEAKKEKERRRRETKMKDRRVRGQSGLTVLFREGDETHGFAWHSRFGKDSSEKGVIVINLAHDDLRAAEDGGAMTLQVYLNNQILRWVLRTVMPSGRQEVWDQICEEEIPQFNSAFVVHPR